MSYIYRLLKNNNLILLKYRKVIHDFIFSSLLHHVLHIFPEFTISCYNFNIYIQTLKKTHTASYVFT